MTNRWTSEASAWSVLAYDAATVVLGTSLGNSQRDLLSWIGLALILSCGVAIGSRLAFPGVAALWPVVGAALILLAGDEARRSNAGALLALPLLSRPGTYAFGIYLWHWPIYWLVYERLGGMPSLPETVLIVLGSGALAVVSYRLRAVLDLKISAKTMAIGASSTLLGVFCVANAGQFLIRNAEKMPVLAEGSLFAGP